jgi:DNA-binding LacI/PurR family transcriptional regulator
MELPKCLNMAVSRPTIYDVARAAGVATSTVSRAFTTPGRVREETRLHILRVAAELGYQANPHARALMSGRTRTVAMVVSDITNPHFFELIRGAELRAKASEYTLVLVNAEESSRIEYGQIQRLMSSVDGFLLAASRLPDENLAHLAMQRPIVLLNRELAGIASVVLDHVQGCRQIVAHLASLGHEQLVYLAGPRNSWMARTRWNAIRQAATDLGLRARRIGPYTPTAPHGGAAADAALGTGATAVIAHNDLLAIGVVQRLTQRSVGVPDDVSVVGFDDIFASNLCSPSLTTLSGEHAKVGWAAVEILLDAVGPARPAVAPPRVVLPTELVIRESTGPAAALAARP